MKAYTNAPLRGEAAVDRAMNGAAEKPLSNGQKAHICMLAAEIYPDQESQVPLEDWRRSEQHRAVGIASLRDCQQQHYNLLVAHFENLLGRSGSAFRRVMRAQSEPRLVALHKIYAECGQIRDVMPEGLKYVRGFLANRKGLTLEDAPAKVLWNAFYMLRRRVQQLRRQARRVQDDNIPF